MTTIVSSLSRRLRRRRADAAPGAAARRCPHAPSRPPARARRGTGLPRGRAPRRRRSRAAAGSDAAAASRSRSNSRPPTSTASAPSAPATSRRAANTGGLSSWRSRSYASGRPFTVASSPVRRPIAVPALPRASSATSGLSFCGIIDEPVARLLGQPREAELRRRPEHELLADAREMREQHRRRVEIVEREVAVGDGVERVPHRVGRRGQRQRRARERARAERRRRRLRGREREPRAVALEHLRPREQMVSERHRLRALQMRVARHRRVRLLARALEDRVRERDERRVRLRTRVRDVEPERGGDLVVARAAGVDLPPHLAELGLDVRVHVLGRGIDGVELRQRLTHLGELRVVEDARRRAAAPRAAASPARRTAAAPRRRT